MKWVNVVVRLWLVVAFAVAIGYIGYTAYLLVVNPAEAGVLDLGLLWRATRDSLPVLFCVKPTYDEMHMVARMLQEKCPDCEMRLANCTCERLRYP
jgi:preprotein translocase subunit Sss1